MKIIVKIAKAELRTLFYSPIAWFVILLFYVSMAFVFSNNLNGYSTFQEVMLDLNEDWTGFDAGLGGVFVGGITGIMGQYLYLFIPLITMGIINREISNGTIKLLYSSPITTREIVFGKFLGLVIFNLVLLFIFAIFLASVHLHTENAEYKWYLSILLGIFLLVSAYAAMGLFISCLTSYQIVAAVITFATFYVLSMIGGLWQQYDLVRDITFALSMGGKVNLMMRGMVASRDVIYFLLIIVLFIGFALIKLKSTQESRKWAVRASRYAMLTLIVIIIGYFSSRPGYIAYADLTKNKINTLHPAAMEALEALDGSPLTVTLYTNLLDENAPHGLPQARNLYVWGVWEPLIRFYPNIAFKYEYYYDINDGDSSLYRKYPDKSIQEIMAIEAEMLDIRQSIFKAPNEIRKMIDLAPEYKRLVMQLEYKGKKEYLRTYRDPKTWPEQPHFAATLKRLTRNRDVTIYFAGGHYERNPFSYAPREYGNHTTDKTARRTMINEGIDTDSISLANEKIPQDIDLLVIADPKMDYSEHEKSNVINYLNNGGNALIYLEPGKQFILAPILENIGVHADDGIIVRLDQHEMPHIFRNKLNHAGNFLAKEPDMELYQNYGIRGGQVENEGVLNLTWKEMNGFKVEPVITRQGNEETWIENGKLVVDSAAPVYDPAEGDLKKDEYVIALKLSRKIGNKEQRIVVTGDSDFMAQFRMKNVSINTAFYSWLLYNQYPIYTNYPFAPDRFLKISSQKAKLISGVYLYFASVMLLLVAIILLVRRKRQ